MRASVEGKGERCWSAGALSLTGCVVEYVRAAVDTVWHAGSPAPGGSGGGLHNSAHGRCRPFLFASISRRATHMSARRCEQSTSPCSSRQRHSACRRTQGRVGWVCARWLRPWLIVLSLSSLFLNVSATLPRVLVTPHRSWWTSSPPQQECELAEEANARVMYIDLDGDGIADVVLPAPCTCLISNPQGPVAAVGDIMIPPDSCRGGFYGHDSSLDPDTVLHHGLSARGEDWDLLRHSLQLGRSAFRGTTSQVVFPDGGGAAAWADEGGYVFELCCVPTWDMNKHLEGRRLVSSVAVGRHRFASNIVPGEHENAVAARVPASHIRRYGRVVLSRSGMPFVPRASWQANPKFDPKLCSYCPSDG